jgi:hypothetical protein
MAEEVAIELPFAVTPHPLEAELEERTRQWARESGMVRSPEAARLLDDSVYSLRASLGCPGAELDDMLTCSQWLVWFFLIDDQHNEGEYGRPDAWPRVARQLIDIVRTGRISGDCPRTPGTESLAELWARTKVGQSCTWIRRIAGHFEEIIAEGVPEAEHLAAHQPPPLHVYVQLRRKSTGRLLMDLMERCAQIEVPPGLYTSAHVDEALSACTDILGWVNDLYSLPKELAHGEVNNVVIVLQAALGTSLGEAIRLAKEWVANRVEAYLRTSELVLSGLAPGSADEATMRRYFSALRAWLGAWPRWHQLSARYLEIQADPPESMLGPVGAAGYRGA